MKKKRKKGEEEEEEGEDEKKVRSTDALTFLAFDQSLGNNG